KARCAPAVAGRVPSTTTWMLERPAGYLACSPSIAKPKRRKASSFAWRRQTTTLVFRYEPNKNQPGSSSKISASLVRSTIERGVLGGTERPTGADDICARHAALELWAIRTL